MEHVAKMVPRDASVAGVDAAHPPCETALWDLSHFIWPLVCGKTPQVWSESEKESSVKGKRPNPTVKRRQVGIQSDRRVYWCRRAPPTRAPEQRPKPPQVQRRRGDNRWSSTRTLCEKTSTDDLCVQLRPLTEVKGLRWLTSHKGKGATFPLAHIQDFLWIREGIHLQKSHIF